MRIILSRKGFDSQNGKQPSPILPDGTLLSLPIPAKDESIKYTELHYGGNSYLEIINELNPKTKIQSTYTCHLDPDLRKDIIVRPNNWVPLFGQAKSSQGHLKRENVKPGDLFLFFGLFRETEIFNGKYRYKNKSPELHVLYGYLQIDKIYNDVSQLPEEFKYHPHAHPRFDVEKNNAIYVGTEKLTLIQNYPGSGCFMFTEDLVLTKKGYSVSKWELPDFFQNCKISYHTRKSFNREYFQSAHKGQEFIIEENSMVTDWAKTLINKGRKDCS